ncbi:hypothetical protein [Borreliella afzelii]|uniref:Antitoxin component YwqK of YwqJK toxin-antitoxin module n=1 Tax=Borreliella afzelii TaxID=29518 RepID=A0AB34Z3N7_BORAF|nr:hypothetical protein [Borreliella afzelii]AJY72076.1 hypothetical protein BAFK78_076 [Borreliella afzelii K78]EEC20992.1 conserved hypothetical protein [Borreliella afzelii ACA-1]MBB5141359.1 antitoxin component YwqK of YwqJK toxin-antitoxin module [Borreliella afzelii]
MKKNQLILLLFIPQIIYAKSYFASDVFFNKYQKLNEKPKTGFYIEYYFIDDIEKLYLYKENNLIKYKTIQIIENTRKITYYDTKDTKRKEEIYDNLNNKIQEIEYGNKGKILETVNYYYENGNLISKNLKTKNQKPKSIYYSKDENGKLLKITGSDFQIWNYGINGDIKSTYFDIKKSTTKVIKYDDKKRSLDSAIIVNNKIKSKEKNQYLDEQKTVNIFEEENSKIISTYQGNNLIKEEIYKNNELIKINDFQYNSSDMMILQSTKEKDKDQYTNTKIEYEYNQDNQLKSKKIYENDTIYLKTEYHNDNEYEEEIYYNKTPALRVKHKNGKVTEEKPIGTN